MKPARHPGGVFSPDTAGAAAGGALLRATPEDIDRVAPCEPASAVPAGTTRMSARPPCMSPSMRAKLPLLRVLSRSTRSMRARGLTIPIVVGGSVITREDEGRLRAQGVAAVFGPAVPAEDIPEAVRRVARGPRPAV